MQETISDKQRIIIYQKEVSYSFAFSIHQHERVRHPNRKTLKVTLGIHLLNGSSQVSPYRIIKCFIRIVSPLRNGNLCYFFVIVIKHKQSAILSDRHKIEIGSHQLVFFA